MRATIRSASGALLALFTVPVIIGLLACLPVPIGNPERSRIDPDITGVWAWLDAAEGVGFYTFEPFDKRTWLLSGIGIEEGREADLGDYAISSYGDFARFVDEVPVGDDGATTTEVALYKAWRTKLGGEWFMTWEPKAVYDEDGFVPDAWLVFRLERPDPDTLDLYMVDGDAEVFKDVEKTRRAYERVLRKNVHDENVYSEDPIRLVRVRAEQLDFFEELADEVIGLD